MAKRIDKRNLQDINENRKTISHAKTFILASTILILPLLVMGQPGNIKGKQKMCRTYTPSTQFIQISGANSSSSQASQVCKTLTFGKKLPKKPM
jgi:hypothetical protein